MVTLTFFFITQRPFTLNRRYFLRLALISRFFAPSWWVEACLALVPTAKPDASDLVWMLLRSWRSPRESCRPRRLPAGKGATCGHPGPLRLEAVQGGRPHALAERCVEFLLIQLGQGAGLPQQPPDVTLQANIYHRSHPLHGFPAENSVIGVKGEAVAAAVLGSLVSLPMLTLPSATRARNLTAAL